MKVEEAISRLQVHKEFISKHGLYTKEAIDVAIQSLEKQEPKKILKKYSSNNFSLIRFHCPHCKKRIGTKIKNKIIHNIDIYCDSCGQKILWED